MQISLEKALNASPDTRPPKAFNTPGPKPRPSRGSSPQNSPRTLEPKILKCNTLQEAYTKMILLVVEIQRLENTNVALIKQTEIDRLRLKERESDLETKISILLAENEKLNDVIEELDKSSQTPKSPIEVSPRFEDWKSLYESLEIDYKTLVQHYNELKTSQESIFKNRDEMAKAAIDEFKDNRILKTKLHDAAQLLREYNNTGKFKPEEVKRFNEMITKLQVFSPKPVEFICEPAESEVLHESYNYGASDKSSDNSSNILFLLREKEVETESLKAELVKLSSSSVDTEDLKSRLATTAVESELLKDQLERLRAENEHLEKKLEVFKVEDRAFDDMKNKVKSLQDENNVLSGLVQMRNREIEELKERIEGFKKMGTENQYLLTEINKHTTKIEELMVENKEIRGKLMELAEARVKIMDLEDALADVKSDNIELTRLYDEINGSNSKLKATIKKYEEQKAEVELHKAKAVIAEAENQTLLRNFNDKVKELEELKGFLNKMEACFSESRQSARK